MQTVRLNLKIPGTAPTQYSAFPFTSMCRFRGKLFGAGPSGVFRFDYGDTDNGTAIAAYFVLPTTTFGQHDTMYERFIYAYGSWDSAITVEVTGNGKTTIGPYTLTADATEDYQRKRTVPMAHMNFSYVSHKVSNVSGGDFLLDKIEAHVTINKRRR